MKKAVVEEIASGAITLPEKVDIPYHLQERNQIPLRSD